MKTAKFGGTSLADAARFRQVKRIVSADPELRFVVVSAPGKRSAEDKKVTDLLYDCHDRCKNRHRPRDCLCACRCEVPADRAGA